jgi:ABC-type histidine transport system ATPase subunit
MGFCKEVSTQVLYLHEGRVEEQGPPEQVFNNPESARCRQFLARYL